MAFVATSDSSRTGIRLVAEVTPGVTPATPVGSELEITGESLNNARQTITSNSFRSDRQVPGATTVGFTNAGDLNIELKKAPIIEALLASALQGLWVGDKLQNGVNRTSWTVEKIFPDATGDQCEIYRGAEITNLSVSMATGQMVTATFGLMARSFADAATTIMSSVTPASTNPFMTAVDDDVVLEVNGVAYTGGLVNFQFSLENNAREQRQIGSANLAGIGMGRSNLTGTLQAYFSGTNSINTAYKNGAPIKLAIKIPDVNGAWYKFTFENLILTSRTRNAGGLDQDVVLEIGFQGTLGGTDSKTLTVERSA